MRPCLVKKKKSKKTRRKQTKYPGLVKSVNRRVIREYMDQDYIDKLSPEEKQWLSNFNEEWLSANFDHEGETLHKSKKDQLEIYNRNNARNRDQVSILKQFGHINNTKNLAKTYEATQEKVLEKNHVEDSMVALIDEQNRLNAKIKK